jgi:IclR family mhp operon transcriptional activator
MSESRPISVVVRTFQLLRALNRQPVSTLDALYKQTSIPKSSIVRLLQTLESEGLVRRAPQYGAYYLTSEVTALSSGYHSAPRIVEASSSVADRLTRELKWPVSIAVQDGDAMVVRYSTIPKTPLSFFHSTINMRISMVTQAMGRAYLAFIDPVEREALVELLLSSNEASNEVDAVSLRAMLEKVRADGYAVRDPKVRPESSTIAVPIFEAHTVAATLGLTWFSTALSLDKALAQFLVPLQQASNSITKSLAEVDNARS